MTENTRCDTRSKDGRRVVRAEDSTQKNCRKHVQHPLPPHGATTL
jgi:hypothetical protein